MAALPHRPHPSLFRADDWKHYQEVNRKFADALLEEMVDTNGRSFWCRTITSPCCPE